LLRKIQIFKALDIEIKKQKGPSTIKRPYKDHKSLKEELGQTRISIIAEISGGNPMHGKVRQSFKPSTHAKSLLENGAKALSVATDPFLYASTDKHLSEVRSSVACPLIRRDFIFEEYQVEESKILGADAIYLSAALLEPERIKALQTLAKAKNLDVVVEVANESELETAIGAEAQIICIVGRNLDTWELSWEKTIKLIKKVPPKQCLRLVEAGITNLKQVKELEALGVHGVIISDVLLNEFYPGKRLGQLLAGIEPAKKPAKKQPAPAPPPAKAKPGKPTATQPSGAGSAKQPAKKPSTPAPQPAKTKPSKSTHPTTPPYSKRPNKGNKEIAMTQAKKAETTAELAAKKPAAKKAAPAKKAAAKAPAKKVTKPVAKKTAVKAPAKKAPVKKAAPAKKTAVKAPAKKAPVKKAAPAKKPAKTVVKKALSAKKPTPKAAPAKKGCKK
jgi:indole-3-glycerol phosphate synthase